MTKKIHFDRPQDQNSILELAGAYQKSRLLLTACKIGIFTLLDNEGKTSKDIAYHLDTDEISTEKLMRGLCILGFIIKKGDLFYNSDHAKEYLVKGSPNFMGDLLHLYDSWDNWSNLTDSVVNGVKSVNSKLQDKNLNHQNNYNSIHKLNRFKVGDIISFIDFKKVNRVLDIGCGTGLYSMNMIDLKPDLEIDVVELEKVTPITLEHLEYEGYENKINFLEGDILTLEIPPSTYDLIFVSQICSEFSVLNNIKLLSKSNQLLKHDGKVIIHDYIMADDLVSPHDSIMQSLNLMLTKPEGDIFTETDYWIMLSEAGFNKIERVNTEHQTSLIFASK